MIYKKGNIWMIRLKLHGKTKRRSAHTSDELLAREREVAFRKELHRLEELEPKVVPTLKRFIKDEYLDFLEKDYNLKPATKTYYDSGTKYLLGAKIAEAPLSSITDRDIVQLASELSHRSASTLNCALRTLRRILHLARSWRFITEIPTFSLAKGEKQRKRVLSLEEQTIYLEHCPARWRDVATIILGTGLRPGEVFALRWEDILFLEDEAYLHVVEGKSEAAKRRLPLIPTVREVILARHRAQGEPQKGWVFPAKTRSGHAIGGGGMRKDHLSAIKAIKGKVEAFPPYCLRHTALTRLGTNGTDVFTLASIAGHSSISITQRYVHPQKDAVLKAFGLKGKDAK